MGKKDLDKDGYCKHGFRHIGVHSCDGCCFEDGELEKSIKFITSLTNISYITPEGLEVINLFLKEQNKRFNKFHEDSSKN